MGGDGEFRRGNRPLNLDRNSKTAWRAMIVLVFVLGAVWIALTRVPPQAAAGHDDLPPLPRASFTAPDFSLETLDGGTLTLRDLQGQIVLVNFWATWCPSCRAEMPAIQGVYEQYRDQGFTVLAVDIRESDAQVAAFAGELGLTFPILMDRSGHVFDLYRVKALPSSFFVDQSGIIREVTIGGPMARAFVESQVMSLLTEEGSE
jgi:peroxiredoxin